LRAKFTLKYLLSPRSQGHLGSVFIYFQSLYWQHSKAGALERASKQQAASRSFIMNCKTYFLLKQKFPNNLLKLTKNKADYKPVNTSLIQFALYLQQT
jgi:hypothetical protein